MTSSLLQSAQKNMDLDERIVTPPKQLSSALKTEPSEEQQTNLYACFNPSALSLFANQTAAAAALMATWPIQLRAQLASTIGLPPHTPFFPPGWPMTPPLSHKSGNSPPPPTSPISPKTKFLNNNNSSTFNNNHIVSTTTADLLKKKKRKATTEEATVPGSISPPTSSSSPGSIDTTTALTTRDPSKDKVFTCKICNRSFGYKHVLQNHERTHTGEKPFECTECHKRFTRDHHLKTHMRLHTGEKPYSCSHCDRQFVQVANLRRHLRVHTGERPYNCELCQSKFSDSNQLKAHMLIHNDEKPFECEKCNGKFRRRHHLMHHKCGDQKSIHSVESDESMRYLDVPMNLSATDGKLMSNFMKKFNESQVKTMLQVPQINFIQTDLPEQTEPEDLSMHSPKSPVSMDELEELEDAATLYAKLQCKKKRVGIDENV
ncbi:hypothetical protein PVAND_016937 [Polypedilum vanderplanki]|uniref:C2H2-type domain-containing protein n=1 Tax=Polypedilum vanderplanki TaxID=319348 RepID=A0A9J6BHM8_POLVA|nr:hypothetical protein PVAND_016937 [Polypedilum vanderplanki]